jgi:hypothetical protein
MAEAARWLPTTVSATRCKKMRLFIGFTFQPMETKNCHLTVLFQAHDTVSFDYR